MRNHIPVDPVMLHKISGLTFSKDRYIIKIIKIVLLIICEIQDVLGNYVSFDQNFSNISRICKCLFKNLVLNDHRLQKDKIPDRH